MRAILPIVYANLWGFDKKLSEWRHGLDNLSQKYNDQLKKKTQNNYKYLTTSNVTTINNGPLLLNI